MNAPHDDRPDIRVGDLVKATRRDSPDVSASGRVTSASPTSALTKEFYFDFNNWDFEVLDRPLPPISEELVRNVRSVFVMASPHDNAHWRAVINYLRANDTQLKESK